MHLTDANVPILQQSQRLRNCSFVLLMHKPQLFAVTPPSGAWLFLLVCQTRAVYDLFGLSRESLYSKDSCFTPELLPRHLD